MIMLIVTMKYDFVKIIVTTEKTMKQDGMDHSLAPVDINRLFDWFVFLVILYLNWEM